MCYAYAKQERVEVRVARIFNTYGPRMNLNDGRVVSNFILQSLQGRNITIYGNGEQTRSFQYVDDLVNGLVSLMNSNYSRPINLGNPEEYKVAELAAIVRDMIGNENQLLRIDKVEDDPQRRKPDITVAMRELNWVPRTKLIDGLKQTVDYFRRELNKNKHINTEDSLIKDSNLYLTESEEKKLKMRNYKQELWGLAIRKLYEKILDIQVYLVFYFFMNKILSNFLLYWNCLILIFWALYPNWVKMKNLSSLMNLRF